MDRKLKIALLINNVVIAASIIYKKTKKKPRKYPVYYGPVIKVDGYYEGVCRKHTVHFKNDFRMYKSTFNVLVQSCT